MKALRLLSILATAGATAAIAQDFEITRSTVDGGGVMRSTGGDFELSGTIGQPDAGAMSGGEFDLTGGFWFPLSLDDCNSDGWVNLIDYDDFDGCLSGPEGGLPLPECNCFDLDGDDDVDLSDIRHFQHAFSGG
jgi:hypothetical protein